MNVRPWPLVSSGQDIDSGRTTRPQGGFERDVEQSTTQDTITVGSSAAGDPFSGRRRRRGRGGSHRRGLRFVDAQRHIVHDQHPAAGRHHGHHRPASSASQVVAHTVANTKVGGTILVNAAGMTLYKFSADSAGMSACSGACAMAWPPVTVASGMTPKGGSGATGTFGTITRSDGTLQVTYNGDPLYTFSGDSAAGDTNGQNLTSDGGTWTVVMATASVTSPAAKTPDHRRPRRPRRHRRRPSRRAEATAIDPGTDDRYTGHR